MKTQSAMKYLRNLTAVVLAAAVFATTTGCKKDSRQSTMVVHMTDAPAAWAEVNVEIQEVLVHLADSSWMTLNTNAGVYNLLDLQNDVTVVIADSTGVPAGHVTQMRLILGSNNSLSDTSGASFALTIPSGQQTGIKINLNTTLQANMTTEVLLDFDAEQSVVDLGAGLYLLKPVIKVESITQF
jgi:hypothetical protein